MLQPRTTTAPVLMALAAGMLGAACSGTETSSSSSSSSSGSTSTVTSVSIDPADFIGDVPCGALPGAMQSYVATITDRSDPAHAFTLPSSPPAACSQRISFRYILAGHSYTARLDGYEEPPSAIVPLGGQLSGSPHMLRVTATGTEPVEPRWTTSCGEDNGEATVAASHARVPIRHCHPLTDHGTPGATAIVVNHASAVADLGCLTSGGQVPAVRLTPIDSTLPAVLGIPCGSTPITYTSVTAGRLYTFYLEAPAAVFGPWGALCFAMPVEGLSVFAVCDPLSETGAITVDAAALFAAKGYDCQDIPEYQAILMGGPSGLMPSPSTVFVSCKLQQAVLFELLAPDDPGNPLDNYVVKLKTPIPSFEPLCTATVQPGRTAVCSPL